MTVEDSPAFLTRASPSFSAGFPGLLGSYHRGAGSPGVAGPRRFYPRYASRLVHLPRRESLRHPWRQASQVRQRPHARWARGAEDRQLKRGIRPDLLLSGLQPARRSVTTRSDRRNPLACPEARTMAILRPTRRRCTGGADHLVLSLVLTLPVAVVAAATIALIRRRSSGVDTSLRHRGAAAVAVEAAGTLLDRRGRIMFQGGS